MDEPSSVARMMVISSSSGEEVLNMTPVELESNWSPRVEEE